MEGDKAITLEEIKNETVDLVMLFLFYFLAYFLGKING